MISFGLVLDGRGLMIIQIKVFFFIEFEKVYIKKQSTLTVQWPVFQVRWWDSSPDGCRLYFLLHILENLSLVCDRSGFARLLPVYIDAYVSGENNVESMRNNI